MKMYAMLQRLAEMFPKQNYHTRLERYLASKNVKSISDVEHWAKQFEQKSDRGLA